jgi:hypothetical protein
MTHFLVPGTEGMGRGQEPQATSHLFPPPVVFGTCFALRACFPFPLWCGKVNLFGTRLAHSAYAPSLLAGEGGKARHFRAAGVHPHPHPPPLRGRESW